VTVVIFAATVQTTSMLPEARAGVVMGADTKSLYTTLAAGIASIGYWKSDGMDTGVFYSIICKWILLRLVKPEGYSYTCCRVVMSVTETLIKLILR
jgi:hypothetical protein